MTVSTTKAEQIHNGNGAATSFPTNFKVLSPADLTVVLRDIETGEETVLTGSADYSVSGTGDDAGATVTYPLTGDPLTPFEQLILSRESAFSQPDSIRNQTGFFPSVLEDGYDRLVLMAQENKAKIDRAIQKAIGSNLDPVLPALFGANRALVSDEAGSKFVEGPTTDEIAGAQGFAQAAENSADSASSSATEASESESAASTSETNAGNSATAAGQSETKAQQWAEEPEDSEVEPGSFSAFHWAAKAEATVIFDVGEIGSLAFLARPEIGTINSGATYPGSELRYAGFSRSEPGDLEDKDAVRVELGNFVPAESQWRALGYAGESSLGVQRGGATLFIRIF